MTGHTSYCELCSNQGWSATVSVWWWQHKLPPRRRRLGEPPTLPALRNTKLVPHGTPRRLYAPRIRKARRQGTTESCAPRHCHKRGQTTQLQTMLQPSTYIAVSPSRREAKRQHSSCLPAASWLMLWLHPGRQCTARAETAQKRPDFRKCQVFVWVFSAAEA